MSTGRAAAYNQRQDSPSGFITAPQRIADQPVPSAESMASQPNPKPRSDAGSSSATTVHTKTDWRTRKNRATN